LRTCSVRHDRGLRPTRSPLFALIVAAALAVSTAAPRTDHGMIEPDEGYTIEVVGPLKDSSPIARITADANSPPLNDDDVELYFWDGSAMLYTVGTGASYSASEDGRSITISTTEHFSSLFPRLPDHLAAPFFLLISRARDGRNTVGAFFTEDERPTTTCPEDRPFECDGVCSTSCLHVEPAPAYMLWLPSYRDLQDDPAFFYTPSVINPFGPYSDAEMLVDTEDGAFAFRPDSLRLFAVSDRVIELPAQDFAFFDDQNRVMLITVPRDALPQPLPKRTLFLARIENNSGIPLLFAFIVPDEGSGANASHLSSPLSVSNRERPALSLSLRAIRARRAPSQMRKDI
jgi:hypothetical protein